MLPLYCYIVTPAAMRSLWGMGRHPPFLLAFKKMRKKKGGPAHTPEGHWGKHFIYPQRNRLHSRQLSMTHASLVNAYAFVCVHCQWPLPFPHHFPYRRWTPRPNPVDVDLLDVLPQHTSPLSTQLSTHGSQFSTLSHRQAALDLIQTEFVYDHVQ